MMTESDPRTGNTVSILIITYNNFNTITNCLDSIFNQTFNSLEILILDNDSSDGTVNLIKSIPNVKVFESSVNLGFSAGVNFLASKASGDYLFLLNPDCECQPDTVSRLVAFQGSNQGAVSASLQYKDGRIQQSAREFISYDNVIFSRKSILHQFRITDTRQAGYLSPEKPSKVPAVSATALLIKAADFKRVDGLDERYFLYLEDIDFCRKLGINRIDVWYNPEIVVTHLLGKSSENSKVKASYYHHLSMFKYFTKHYPDNYIRNAFLTLLLLIGLILSSVIFLIRSKKSGD